jgi:hypothetical protein
MKKKGRIKFGIAMLKKTRLSNRVVCVFAIMRIDKFHFFVQTVTKNAGNVFVENFRKPITTHCFYYRQ